MGQIARQAAEELLQSSRTELAPLEELERTRGEFRRRVENNLNQLPGFDPATEVKRRNLQQATEQLVEARRHFEAAEVKGAQKALATQEMPDVLVNIGRLPKNAMPEAMRMTMPEDLKAALGKMGDLQPRMRSALLLVVEAKKLQEGFEHFAPSTVDWKNFSTALAEFEKAVYSEAKEDPGLAELGRKPESNPGQ